MKDITIKGTHISSTTRFDNNYVTNDARLDRNSAWRPLVNDIAQWLQVGVSIHYSSLYVYNISQLFWLRFCNLYKMLSSLSNHVLVIELLYV